MLGVLLSNCGKLILPPEYKVTPNPLEMHADSVEVTISGTFPEKGLHKKAVAEITPVIKYKDGGEKALKSITLQGEKVEANNNVIAVAGGSFSYNDKVAFEEGMRMSSLEVRASATKKSKTLTLDPINIAPGVIATPGLVMLDSRPILLGDNFVRITSESKGADIHFPINSSNYSGAELKAEDIKLLKDYIKEATENERRQFKGVKIEGYASPDGPQELNTGLAEKRAGTAKDLLGKEFKKVEEAKDAAFFASSSTAEDWDGFKSAMQESSIEDKDLILKVLSMYSDADVREKEIKNISQVYTTLKSDILPKLRRSKMNVKVDVVGYSDEEIKAIFSVKPDSLKVEELLYAATLYTSLDDQLKVYKAFISTYPSDVRGPNNAGYCLLKQGKVGEAKKYFEDAKAIENSNSAVMNNLGAVAIREGEFDQAIEYLKSSGGGAEVNYNMGIISVKRAGLNSDAYDYGEAVAKFGSDCSFNAALAKLLAGSVDQVVKTIDCAENKDDAMMYYLKAIAGARQGDSDLVFNSLRVAVEKDASIGNKAKNDMEFGKYMEDDTFKSIVK